MPQVSVIIPTYNRADYIEKTIQSVMAQTYRDYEIIVVDDGSTDHTDARLGAYSTRLKYIYQDNQERSIARNRGAEAARGRYFLFLDSDDLMFPNQLALQMGIIEKQSDVGLVAGGWEEIDEEGMFLTVRRPWEVLPQLDVTHLLVHCPIIPSATLVRREWFEQVGGFDPLLPPIEDTDMWIRLAYAGCRMAWLKESACQYRIFTTLPNRELVRRTHRILDMRSKFYAKSDLPPELLAIKDWVFGRAYLQIVAVTCGAGQLDGISENLERAIQHDPSLLDNCFEYVFQMLVDSVAHSYFVPHPVDFIGKVFVVLPGTYHPLKRRKREGKGMVAMSQFFDAVERRDWAKARRMSVHGITNGPSWLRNRGVLSLLVEAWLGEQTARVLRRVL